MLTPKRTRTVPASTMPATRAGADTSRRSSVNPTAKMTVAARSTPSGSLDPSNTAANESICQATAIEATRARNMAMPPMVAVGTEWTRRSSGATTAP